jgi:hypothetical protein
MSKSSETVKVLVAAVTCFCMLTQHQPSYSGELPAAGGGQVQALE